MDLQKLAESIASSQKRAESMNETIQTTHVLMRRILEVVKDERGPASTFELSQSFFPEQYSITPATRRIRVYDGSEISCSSTTRVDEYHLFYSATPRQWCSVSLTITTFIGSVFWDLSKLPQVPLPPPREATIPRKLEAQLERYLQEDGPSDDLTRLSVELFGDKHTESMSLFHKKVLQAPPNAAQRLLDFVRDLGCSIFPDKAVCFQMYAPQPREFVCALPGRKYCSERRIRCNDRNLEDLKWELSFYNCLKDSRHVSNLVGVVTDHKVRYIKSILRDAEPGGIWALILDFSKKKEAIPLHMRLDWARQIIAGLRDIHEKGFVVGKLEIHSLGVDNSGNIQLHGHCRQAQVSELRPLFVPPEFRTSGTPDSVFSFTSRSDLFQLGVLLWQIAEFEVEVDFGLLNGSWFNPSCPELPHFKNPHIPEWYIQIVNSCQREEAGARLSAAELLELFPPSSVTAFENSVQSHSVLWNCNPLGFHCNHCVKLTTLFYNCRICDGGDYDICDACVRVGIHCRDEKHFLEEMYLSGQSGALQSTGRYHSKETSEGERKDTVLCLD